MTAIIAFIQPFQLESVVNVSRQMPRFPGMSVTEVRGFRRRGAHPPQERELAEVVPLKKKIRLEIYSRGSEAMSILQTIRQAARYPWDWPECRRSSSGKVAPSNSSSTRTSAARPARRWTPVCDNCGDAR